jgi:L-ascorbate peroxidase
MFSAEAVNLAGGPVIKMRYGRKDANAPAKEGNLPAGMAPFPKGASAAQHLRDVFHRMGFNDKDIVTLSGAHTVGRAFKERSGATTHGYGSKGTKYTSDEAHVARKDGKPGKGMLGGQSWTKKWLTFDNEYFRTPAGDKELLRLDTDKVLQTDPGFAPHFKAYAQSNELFLRDYADVHKRLSELGSQWMVKGGISIDELPSKL